MGKPVIAVVNSFTQLVPGHVHLHALPRWTGDTSFMTSVSETRVLPEDLEITWEKLRAAFAAQRA